METLRTVGWLVCGIYATIPAFWLIIHPFANFWRKRFRAPLKLLGVVWMLLWAVAWLLSSPLRNEAIPSPWWLGFGVVPLWATSLFIYFGGQRHFSLNQVIGRTELESDRHEQVLVTTGLHARMRHPLYLGHLCTMLGWLTLARSQAVLALLLWAVATGTVMIRFEDAELEQRFGETYREYRHRVPAVIPKLI
jgi:protein-S-isoprenylcysteine O-methyltransferase Ste14